MFESEFELEQVFHDFQTSITELIQNSQKQKVRKIPSFAGPYDKVHFTYSEYGFIHEVCERVYQRFISLIFDIKCSENQIKLFSKIVHKKKYGIIKMTFAFIN